MGILPDRRGSYEIRGGDKSVGERHQSDAVVLTARFDVLGYFVVFRSRKHLPGNIGVVDEPRMSHCLKHARNIRLHVALNLEAEEFDADAVWKEKLLKSDEG